MRFIDNRGCTDPRLNLALEEHVLRQHRGEESYLLFYVNAPSIIIGRNQNTAEEVNVDVRTASTASTSCGACRAGAPSTTTSAT